MIIIAVVLGVGFIIFAAIICVMMFGGKKRRNPYQNQYKSVLVRNGVDVKKQVMGGEKGEYFTGNLEKQETYYVNSAVAAWKIVFDNLNTRERQYVDFSRQMWIGRTSRNQNEGVKLVLANDEKVSRSHCTIYEAGGTLCLQDLNSSNHTYLNGNIITKAVYLKNGDVIRVGNTQLRVQYSVWKIVK